MIRNPLAQRTLEYLQQVLFDFYIRYSEQETVTTSDYTTEKDIGHEWIYADGTGTQTITLHSGAFDGQLKSVKKKSGTGTKTVDTEGSENIDGASSQTLSDAATYRWSDGKGEWSTF